MAHEEPRRLDFVVIGAQKAGTTTLFEHLRRHPDLFLPASKEAPFFNRDDLFDRGFDWYMHEHFARAPAGALLGTVTPQYMCAPGVADRLAATFPEAKLVALLRDPVGRALSHYRMEKRRGTEARSFDDAILDQLRPEALEEGRRSTVSTATYVAWSEYGRILDGFADRFPQERLRIWFTDELESDPDRLLRAIHAFLGVEHVSPPTLGEHFHVGTEAQRIRVEGLRRRARLRAAWRRLPVGLRMRLGYRFRVSRLNAKAGGPPVRISPDVEDTLRAHLQPDRQRLEARFGAPVPWR